MSQYSSLVFNDSLQSKVKKYIYCSHYTVPPSLGSNVKLWHIYYAKSLESEKKTKICHAKLLNWISTFSGSSTSFLFYLRGSEVSVWHASSAPEHWSPAGGRETCFWLWCTLDHWHWPGQSSAPWSLRSVGEEWWPPPDGSLHSWLPHLSLSLAVWPPHRLSPEEMKNQGGVLVKSWSCNTNEPVHLISLSSIKSLSDNSESWFFDQILSLPWEKHTLYSGVIEFGTTARSMNNYGMQITQESKWKTDLFVEADRKMCHLLHSAH